MWKTTKLWFAFMWTTLLSCIGVLSIWWFNYEPKFVDNTIDWYEQLENKLKQI